MDKKYAFITGVSSGLGREMARYLVEEGYIVFGASRRGAFFPHQNFVDLEMDVTDEESVHEAFKIIGQETSGLHVLVNNAGIFEMASFDETDIDLFRDHIETNLVGAFLVFKAVRPFLLRDTTHVINISSLGAKQSFPHGSAYCASKFGLSGLVESLREEWKEEGIRFSSLLPGAIDTPIWESVKNRAGFKRGAKLSIQDFMHVFDMVIKSPHEMQFSEVSFLHKRGILE